MARKVVVIGAGIVGVSIARELAGRPGVRVTVVERDEGRPRGSTTFAPGFVGLYNDTPVLTELARASARVYESVRAGFSRPGGLELATSDAGAHEIERRAQAARTAGLTARTVSRTELPQSVDAFVDTSRILAATHFADDGVAAPTELTAALRAQAESAGAVFVAGHEVSGVGNRDGGFTVVGGPGPGRGGADADAERDRDRDRERLDADDVVLAGGVWGAHLARLVGLELPLFPVAHPYVYSASDPWLLSGPFVRWPEHHVYARVHGDRLGLGSYDHLPVPVEDDSLTHGAGLPWSPDFDASITAAQQLLRPQARFDAAHKVNGVFAMTPDNLPFLGAHPDLPGVWVAQAIWVTHAAGAARALADALTDGPALPREVAVDRFEGREHAALRDDALRLYRDIYAHESGGDSGRGAGGAPHGDAAAGTTP
ncbi:NAD(P)/FAD-dependent oxidoreductase [Antribacter gilvus]|uniref:NAD(P)/FAD-dependent oxidoreductase n=1 Tax=Antribacter gilvus TaxID=2304675 RepID=UPI000F77BB29|nr:FAD-dependent oxidoreductase [Antribacter gilvus]